MFQKKYKEPESQWREIDKENVIDDLTGYYNSVDLALKDMQENPGHVCMTPWAMYRWVEDEA